MPAPQRLRKIYRQHLFDALESRLLLSGAGSLISAGAKVQVDDGPKPNVVWAQVLSDQRKNPFHDPAPKSLAVNLINGFGGSGVNGYIPPDTMGAVGPNHVMEFINDQVTVRDKATGNSLLQETGDAFWANAGASGITAFDPRIVYDPLSGHWFASSDADSGKSNSRLVIGVSTTSDPTQPWVAFAFPSNNIGNWGDFPTLGLDKNGVYMAVDLISGNSNNGCRIYAWSKSDFLNFASGGPTPAMTTFSITNPATLAILPTYDFNPNKAANAPEFLADRSGSFVELRTITWNGSTPSLSGVSSVSVPGVNGTPLDATQPGSNSQKLDTGFGWLVNACISNSSQYLWTTVPTELNGHSAAIWVQINLSALSVVQSGQVADASADILYASIAANDSGDAMLGFTKVSSTMFASVYAQGRLGTDAPGTLEPQILVHAGSAIYTDNNNSSTVARWGDYSITMLDPTNPAVFWSYQEYAPSSAMYQWGTYWAELDLIQSYIRGTTYIDTNGNGTFDNTEMPLPGVTVFLDSNSNGVLDLGGSQSTGSGSINLSVPDNNSNGRTVTLPITLTGSVSDVNVTLNINMNRDSDLTVSLIAPDGTTQVTLFSGLSGTNFTNTTLDDQATTSISASTSQSFTGTYMPVNPLSAFNGIAANGNWTLKIVDNRPSRTATLMSWSITVTTAGEPSAITAADGSYTFANLAPGNYNVAEVTPSGYTRTGAIFYPVNLTSGTSGIDFGNAPFTSFSTGPAGILHLWTDPTHTFLYIGNSAAQSNPTYTYYLASLPALSFQLTDTNSELIVDYANGSPLPAAGVTLDGGGFSSSTLLVLAAGQTFTMTDTQIGLQAAAMISYANLGTLSIQNSTLYYTGDLSTLNLLSVTQSTFYWTVQ